MRRPGLFGKLYAGFALLIAVTSLLFGLFAIPELVDGEERETRDNLLATTALLASWAEPVLAGEKPADDLQTGYEPLERRGALRLTLIREDGRVLADSHHDPATMDDHSRRPEIVAARIGGTGIATRMSHTLDQRLVYAARRVDREGVPLGYVRLAQSLEGVDLRKARLRGVAVVSAFAAMLIGLVVALLVSRRLTRPLRSLIDAAETVAHGGPAELLPVTTHDEMGRLTETFNRMAGELNARIDTISRDRTELLAMLSAMAEGVLAVDAEEKVVLINDAAGRLLGLDLRRAVGHRLDEVTKVAEVGEVVHRVMVDGTREEREVCLPTPARDRFLQLLGAPVQAPGDPGRGAVLVVHDISELRHLEKVRRDFVANVSHELKTPLSVIRGFAETILEDPDMDPATRGRFLDKVRQQTLRLSDLVEEVLVLSRLESQENPVAQDLVDMVAPVREAVHGLQSLATEKGISLSQRLPFQPVVVRGEEEAILRVAGNLLDNALKYTPSGGRVEVRVAITPAGARLEVEDTGIGIPPDARERVFERFYRVDPGRSREAGGTGLGLSIVKHLVQGMAGRVWVEGVERGGSRFCVELPLARPGGADGRGGLADGT